MKKNNITSRSWQFWIDRGGTFTDIVALAPDGHLISKKLLSNNPELYADAALQGIHECLKSTPDAGIATVKMGTTVATNALLERKGEATALLITQGFQDCLRIAYQNRPDIFALHIQRPELLYQTVIEINERLDANGKIRQAIDTVVAKKQLESLYRQGFRSIAIVLMHAWRYPEHELLLADLASTIGFSQISLSHQVSPFMKIVSRGDTTVADAYLSPILRRYIDQVSKGLSSTDSQAQILFMQSNGGLTVADKFQGKDSILSGPAGGIVGAIKTSEKAGYNKIIAFDMGGTSTDVAHYAGDLERSHETEIAGVRIRVPMMNIHTVAAGGGSLLFFDGLRYRVGPQSAGADPGPAGYRRGGALTVTDANILLGKLPLFPAVFGQHGDLSLDTDKVTELFDQLTQQITAQTGNTRSPQQVAEGFIDIAVENMASAIKTISVQKGYDVSEYTLCCYGAAAGQHACKVADRLAMTTIMLHPLSGVLSAYGMGLAELRLIKEQSLEQDWETTSEAQLRKKLEVLQQRGRTEMLQQTSEQENIESICRVNIRFFGTDTAFSVLFADKASMLHAFEQQYRQQFGFVYTDKSLVIESIAVEIISESHKESDSIVPCSEQSAQPILITTVFSDNSHHQTPVYERHTLTASTILKGPLIIIDATSTTVIEPGWQGEITPQNNLILTRIKPLIRPRATGTQADPVLLEIFNKRFMSIAEQMGFVLQNTAYSVNIKERLDFSCALFDANAQLIANAPHIPVHLGSMGESVLAVLKSADFTLQAHQVYLINSPYHGGTHLPDITVVSPVFDAQNARLLFFVASRGHHADVGGMTPGSMPANSQHIEQEGVISAGFILVSDGQFQENTVRQWLSNSPYPARNPEQNIADLHAQIAANNKGVVELQNMVKYYSLPTVLQYMQFVQDHASACVRDILGSLSNGSFVNTLDDNAKIVVSIQIDPGLKTATIDFTGTSAQLLTNFNAPAAICKAAVLYVFRTLVKDDIPLNAGCLKPLTIKIPENSMLNPQYPAAVVAGNVETSQYIVDALYGALGLLAGSQGTMNNFTFGNADHQYYETICGGSAAGKGFNGCDAVQTHMTNSRITDPEVLEWRFPVLLEEFSIRQNSGGSGQWHGGNGVNRKIRFLSPMTATILSSHRIHPPHGIQQGLSAQTGINTVYRTNGEIIELPGCCQTNLNTHDVIQIKTPGGGGYGAFSKKK